MWFVLETVSQHPGFATQNLLDAVKHDCNLNRHLGFQSSIHADEITWHQNTSHEYWTPLKWYKTDHKNKISALNSSSRLSFSHFLFTYRGQRQGIVILLLSAWLHLITRSYSCGVDEYASAKATLRDARVAEKNTHAFNIVRSAIGLPSVLAVWDATMFRRTTSVPGEVKLQPHIFRLEKY